VAPLALGWVADLWYVCWYYDLHIHENIVFGFKGHDPGFNGRGERCGDSDACVCDKSKDKHMTATLEFAMRV